jgi:hypothetical protein
MLCDFFSKETRFLQSLEVCLYSTYHGHGRACVLSAVLV